MSNLSKITVCDGSRAGCQCALCIQRSLRASNRALREALRECVSHVEHADDCGYSKPDSCIACGALALLAASGKE